jgi:hypothetical protein
VVGCGRQHPVSTERDPTGAERAIMDLVSLYSAYKMAHGQQQPKDINELKAWVKKQKPETLKKWGVANVDEAFVSPRDKQPFVLNPIPRSAMGGQSQVLVYEKVGVDGKRQTISTQGTVSYYNEEELRIFVPNLK